MLKTVQQTITVQDSAFKIDSSYSSAFAADRRRVLHAARGCPSIYPTRTARSSKPANQRLTLVAAIRPSVRPSVCLSVCLSHVRSVLYHRTTAGFSWWEAQLHQMGDCKAEMQV